LTYRRRNPRLLALLVLLFVAVALALPAAAEIEWRRAALWGADVRSLAFDPRDPDVAYAGTAGGHVYVSRDGGGSWAEVGEREVAMPGWVVSDLLFDPDVPGRLWAAGWGTHDGGMVVYTDDGGTTWEVPGDDLYGTKVYVLARVAGRPGTLYAGTLSGVWKSTDGAETWTRLTAQLPAVHKVTSLMLGPGAETVIAGTWERAWRSEDGGATWYGVFAGMILDSEVFTLTRVPGKPNEVWASTCGWVYRSLDGGSRWQRFTEGFENRRTPAFAALPSGRLLAGTVAGLHLSDDGGAHWRRVGPADLSILDLAWHPARPGRVLVASEGDGVWVSGDGGATLARSDRGMRNVRVAALARSGRDLMAAVNHAGSASGIHLSRDGGLTFAAEPSPLPAVRDLAPYAVGVYAATERGLYERSAGSWRLIGEVGQSRVEQVVVGDGRMVARTAQGLWEFDGPRFKALDYKHGRTRSAALAAGALWVSDADGLYRLTSGSNDSVETPFAGGRIARFGDRLAWWGRGGFYVRPAPGDPWLRLAEGPVELFATGDGELPALVVAKDGTASLWHADSGALQEIGLPLPAHEVSAAMVDDGKLLLGTAGFGLYVGTL
jgi:photosystem II stability/assembly factor-like uncharacterized protein